MSSQGTIFTGSSVTLRPPRVLILFRDGPHWQEFAKLAIASASEIWGGGGFAYIPYGESGGVSAKFHPLVRAFDPDHVVVQSITLQDWERLAPGYISIDGLEAEVDRAAWISKSGHNEWFEDPVAEVARTNVARMCSPMLDPFYDPDEPAPELVTTIGFGRIDAPFLGAVGGEGPPAIALGASREWTGNFALAAAARAGIVPTEERVTKRVRAQPRDEELVEWLVGSTAPPDELLWFSGIDLSARAEDQETWFSALAPELVEITTGNSRVRGAIVIGDTAADFAVAHFFEKLLGYGLWLGGALNAPLTDATLSSAKSLVAHRLRAGTQFCVLSFSASMENVTALAAELDPMNTPVGSGRPRRNRKHLVLGMPDLSSGLRNQAMSEHLETRASVPVDVQPDGGFRTLSPVRSPIPEKLRLPTSDLRVPYWYVEVAFESRSMPRGRGLRPAWLTSTFADVPEVAVRSSRNGFTFDPSSEWFVSPSMTVNARVSTPVLVELGMLSWVKAMSKDRGVVARLSTPGQSAELVGSLLGSRAELVELMSGPSFALLRKYVAFGSQTTTSSAFPNGGGVVLDGREPYLTLAGMQREIDEGESLDLRSFIDRLTVARLLVRGLMLRCTECGRVSFVPIGNVSVAFECPRCAASNNLVSASWGRAAEPEWFYDLHPSFRELLSAHGDLPILAAKALRLRSKRAYAETAEVEFGHSDAGKPFAEVDLIAHVDGDVVLVEAKSSASLGNGKEREASIRKKLLVADMLRADEIVLATSEEAWPERDVAAIRQAAGRIKELEHLRVTTLVSLGVRT